MNEKQAAIISLKSLLDSCEKNGIPPADDNDAFMRGFAAAHRKIGAFIPHIIDYLEDDDGKQS